MSQVDKVHGHLLADSLERARTALDTFVAATATDIQGETASGG